MPADENTALVRRFFEEFCNGRRLELAEELMTPGHVYHDPQIPNVVGPQAMAQAVAVYQNSLNGPWNVEELAAAEGDRVVVRWTGTGTHTAEFNGIPPRASRSAWRPCTCSGWRAARSPSSGASGTHWVCCSWEWFRHRDSAGDASSER